MKRQFLDEVWPMLFPTLEYAVFFFVVFGLSWSMIRFHQPRKYFLVAASYLFYGFWDIRFVLLLGGCSIFNYLIGRMLAASFERENTDQISKTSFLHNPKSILTLGIIANLGTLGFFKYYGFFMTSLGDLLGIMGWSRDLPLLEILLPVGISFFIFQGMSYIIDVYRKEIPARTSCLDVMLYISFFPQLVAGPIVRADAFLVQLEKPPRPDQIPYVKASLLIMGGLFKKVIIANYLATELVDPYFQQPTVYGSLDGLWAIYGYAIQIYCDFSAYSDIAIGCAALLGYHFDQNFNQPYRASSLQDFWRRWHISLSSWLKDYLYIPLGGSKGKSWKTYRNLLITMLLGGLWHGASWNFVIWGALHGGMLSLERLWIRRKKSESGSLNPLKFIFSSKTWGVFWVFHFVCLTWIFFRAEGFGTSLEIISSILSLQVESWAHPEIINPFLMFLVLVGMSSQFIPHNLHERLERYFIRLPSFILGVTGGLFLVVLGALGPEGVAPFIYFQF